MNAERPLYKKREFYGPLELSPNVPTIGHRYMLEHPDDSTKLVRTVDTANYVDADDMDKKVHITQQVLEGLKAHGINHVNPTYINETTTSNEPHMLIVVDKLKDPQPYGEILGAGNITAEQTYEADRALSHMFDYLHQVMDSGGYASMEMMHLGQFIYDDSQPQGQKMVLVDVEPFGAEEVNMSKDSLGLVDGLPTILAATAATLTSDAINLASKTSYPVESLQKAAEIIELLPGDSEQTNKMKEDILRAIDNCNLSYELMYYASAGAMDEYPED